MFIFLKAQASSIISTGVDFLVTFILKSILGTWFFLASIIGTICGGVVNFLLGRNWVFSSRDNKASQQLFKYVIVWLGSFLLNASGLYLFTEIIKFEEWISKIMVSLIVGIGYNYVLQKFFVFKKGAPAPQIIEG
jgi:putative flippase GtrA